LRREGFFRTARQSVALLITLTLVLQLFMPALGTMALTPDEPVMVVDPQAPIPNEETGEGENPAVEFRESASPDEHTADPGNDGGPLVNPGAQPDEEDDHQTAPESNVILEPIPVQIIPDSTHLGKMSVAPWESELIVCYQANSQNQMSTMGVQATDSLQAGDVGSLVLFSVQPGISMEDALAELQQDPNVLYAEPNYRVWAAGDGVDQPNDPSFSDQWGLAAIDAPAAWLAHEQALAAAEPIRVAVLDTGVDVSHEDLAGRLLAGHNFASYRDDGEPYGGAQDYSDDHGHGTQVTGIIAAVHNNGLGISGVAGPAPVEILPVKVLNDQAWGTVFDLANGIRYAADQGARVINLSLTVEQYSQTLASAIRYAQDQGALVVAAVGNVFYRIYPAALPGVIAVGSVDMYEWPSGSERSNYLDLVAPGKEILTTSPNQSYELITGSSASAAHVSAAAALYLLLNPAATATDVEQALAESADDLQKHGEGWDDYTGHGLLNLPALLGVSPQGTPTVGFIAPQPDATVFGNVLLEVEVGNASACAGVAFYLDEVAGNSLLGEVAKQNPGQSFFTLSWDTTTAADGEHLVYAQTYDSNGQLLGTPAELCLQVENQSENGFTLQVLAPNGAAAHRDAWLMLYRRMGESEYGYDPAAPYWMMGEFGVDEAGLVHIPGSLALDLHEYVAVVQGDCDIDDQWVKYIYAVPLEGPASAVLDGSGCVPVTFSLLGLDGEELPYAWFFLRLKDKAGAPITIVTSEPTAGQTQLYLDAKLCDVYAYWSPAHAENYDDYNQYEGASYFLTKPDVALEGSAAHIQFDTFGASLLHGQANGTDGQPRSAELWLGLEGDRIADITRNFYLPFYEDEIVVTPGEYDLYCTLSDNNWDYTFSHQGFVIEDAGSLICNFGGPLTFTGEVLTPVLPEGGYLNANYRLLDSYGNTITAIWLPQGSYYRTETTVTMTAYDSEGNLLSELRQADFGYPYAVGEYFRKQGPGDYLVQLRVPVGPLFASMQYQTGMLPFAVRSEPAGKAVQVYDWDDLPAASWEDWVYLYHLVDDEWGLYGDWVKYFEPDEQGMIYIPEDIALSPHGNFLACSGTQYGNSYVYIQEFDTLDDLKPIHLSDCSASVDIDVLDSQQEPADDYYVELYFLPEGSDGRCYPSYIADVESRLYATPGSYTLMANGEVPVGSLAEQYIWYFTGELVADDQSIELSGADAARLTVGTVGGLQPGDFVGVYGLDSGLDTYWWKDEAPELHISPGEYTMVNWPSLLDEEWVDGRQTRWLYALALSEDGSGVLRTAAQNDYDLVVGGAMSMNIVLEETDLTTADALAGEVRITDAQGNRLVGIQLVELYDHGGGAYSLGEYLQVNDAGQVLIPRPEVMAETDDWPFVYPFLRLYRIDPETGEETRVFNQYNEHYFYDFSLPLDWLTPSEYRLEVAIGLGPAGLLTAEKLFSLKEDSSARLDPPPAAATNQTDFTLSGTAAPGADVAVYYRLGQQGVPLLAGTATADGIGRFVLSFTLPGDAPDGEYVFTVRTVVDGVESPDSPAVCIQLDRDQPQPATNLRAEAEDANHIRLTWEAAPDEDVQAYRLFRGSTQVAEVAATAGLTWLDSGLTALTTYEYSLVAVDLAGNCSDPVTASATTTAGVDGEPPAAPAKPQAVYQAGGAALVTWAPTSDNIAVVSYKLFRAEGEREMSELCEVAADQPLQYADSGLLAETAYSYAVRAYDAAGNQSELSPPCVLQTPAINVGPLTYRYPLSAGRLDLQQIYPQAEITFMLLGERSRQGSVQINYTTAIDDSGAALPLPEERTATVELTEDAGIPGVYTGAFTLPPGTVQVLAILGTLTDGSHPATTTLTGSPLLQVTADLTVRLPESSLSELAGLTLSVLASKGKGQTALVEAGKTEYLFEHLLPADDYRVTVKGSYGRNLVDERLAVFAGVPNSVTAEPHLTAQLTVRVLDPDGQPLSGVGIYAYNQFTHLATTAATDTDGTAALQLDVVSGEDVRIQTQLPDELLTLPLQERQEAIHRATAGSQLVDIVIEPMPMATIRGQVTLAESGEPMSGVQVTAVHRTGARSVPVSTISGADGAYTLQVPAGNVRLSASSPMRHVWSGYPGGNNYYLSRDQELAADIGMSLRGPAQLEVELHTKYIDQPEMIVDGMDWWTAVHFRMRVTDSTGRVYSSYPFDLLAEPYEEVLLSVDGREAGLPTAEVPVELDEERRGQAVIHLEEYGRIVGRLVDDQGNDFPLGPRPQDWSVQLQQLDSNGLTRNLLSANLDSAAFQISAPGPGPYMVRISHGPIYSGGALVASPQVSVGPIEVGLFQIVDLGNVQLSWGTSNAIGSLSTGTQELSAGATLGVSATFGRRTNSSLAMEDARLTIDLPAGCELVAGSLTYEGQPIAAQGSNPIVIDLGDLPASGRTQRRVNFMVRLDEDLPAVERMLITGRLDWTEGTFAKFIHLVPAEIQLARVTIEGPALVVRRETVVSGRGPVGASIAVYDDTELLGMTEVSAGGYWQLPIRLPDWGSPVVHALYATAERDESRLQSNYAFITYDPAQPVITEITFQQGQDGRLVTFNPADGVARFPYVVRPTAGPFKITLQFSQPDLVKNAKVAVAPFDAEATRMADDRFQATVDWSGHQLGAIHIEYETRHDPSQLQQQELADLVEHDPEEAENVLRHQTMPGLRDFTVEISDPASLPAPEPEDPLCDWPDDAAIAAVDFTFPQADLKARVTLAVASDLSYNPTAEQIEQAQTSGIPVYDFEMVGPIVTSDRIRMWMSGYVDMDAIPEPDPGRRFRPAASLSGFKRVLMDVDWTGIKEVYDMNDKVSDLNSLLNAPGQFDPMKQLQDMAFGCGESSQYYLDLLNNEAKSMMVGNALNWAMKAAGVFLTPATFGLGTLALFAMSEALSWATDQHHEDRLTEIRQEMASDPDCRDDDDDYDDDEDEWWHKVADDIRRRQKAAEPTWIWDPSGIVYAGVMENPVQGVTATLYQVDPDSGELTFWDAEWFGQENPLQTDARGYYGWDVPVGQWQVVYEKDGYMPALSEVLPVPPPQTEVHINLVNLTPPQVIAAGAVADGSYLQFNFDQYMLVASLGTANIELTYTGDEGLAYVAGSVDAPAAVASSFDPDVLLTRAVRFVPNEALDAEQEYQLTVGGTVQNYGGIPMGVPHSQAITVPDVDVPVPEVEDLELDAECTWIDITWEDPSADYLQVKLAWTEAGSGSEMGQVLLAQGEKRYQISGLLSDTEYQVRVSVIDSLGRESAGLVRQVATLEAKLPFDPYPPKPPKPPVTSDPPAARPVGEVSNLKAAAGDGSLTITWTEPADSNLKQIKLAWQVKGTGQVSDEQLLGPGVGTYTITGLTNDTEYEVSVWTIDRQGRQSQGRTVVGMPLAAGTELVPLSGEQQLVSAFGSEFRLSIPAGAFTPGEQLRVQRQAASGQPADPTLSLVSPLYLCAAGAADPGSPLYLALEYSQELLGDSDARQLGIYRQDEEQPDRWVYIGGTVDLFNRRLTAQINRLGCYAVLLARPVFADAVGHWGQRDIEVMAARGLAAGVGGGNFEPNRPTNRAELISFMVRLVLYSGLRVDDVGEQVEVHYSDVPADAWYSGTVQAAAQLGLISAGDNLARPGEPATRAEMAAMLVRVMELLGQPPTTQEIPALPFSDLGQLSDQTYLAIARAWYKGLMGGVGAGRFQPEGTATRAQVAAVMLRVLERAGLLTTAVVERGTLQVSQTDSTRFELVDCQGETAAYALTAISEEVRSQLQGLVGQTVQITALRVQGDAAPALRVLGVAKSAGG
jgi:chitodextrinase